ncbi:hypothetical protein [Variovorax sp. LjRoot178]|uniref:hypothetical protein n=1 Tax=Variovorax sp. LjRoot178 TaxID=3342277 RepID=UPI003ECFF128
MADRDLAQPVDLGTRQWNPAEHLDSVRMGLHQRLDSQRARRAAGQAVAITSSAPPTARAPRRPIAQITLSYAELLRIVEQAAPDQRSVTLTQTTDNVYVKPVLQGSASVTGRAVGELIALELALRDRLESNVARRYLAMQGVDHRVDEQAEDTSEPAERMGM